MKKIIVLLLATLVACTMAFSLVGCGHTHEFGDYKNDASKHWKECACGEKSEEGDHVDENDDGKCDVCDYVYPHTHDYGDEIKYDENKHWKECACGDKIEEADHVDENDDGKCDVCPVEIPMDSGAGVTGGGIIEGGVQFPDSDL